MPLISRPLYLILRQDVLVSCVILTLLTYLFNICTTKDLIHVNFESRLAHF
jgi:hypothetical protein